MKFLKPLALLTSAGSVSAFWRMECRGRVGVGRIDPLISPGAASLHSHAIHGSSGFNEKATYEDLVNGECTSCAVVQDKSAYWAPNLYFRHANGTYQEVTQVGGMLAYYFLFPDAKNPEAGVTAFPNNFRMIAGDATRRNYSVGGMGPYEADPEKSLWKALGQTNQHDLAQRAIGFNCLNYAKAPEGTLYRHYLPPKAYLDEHCADGVRFELMFPSCWNGKDITSANFKDHVAYPDLVMTGTCPDGFDVKLPGLMYETIWATNEFVGVPGEFVISHGDVQGFGYHGDFISGWDENFLQAAVNQCTNLSGKLSDCPIFTLQSEDEQRACKMKIPEIVKNEKVTGLIGESLPGNIVIQYGPEPATAARPTNTEPNYVPVPTASYSAGVTASAESDILPGGVFKERPTSTVEATFSVEPTTTSANIGALAEPSPEPTPAPIPSDPPIPEGYSLVRTDYITNGNTVSKIVVIETVEYVMLATETVTVTATATPGSEKVRREHIHMHRHHHARH